MGRAQVLRRLEAAWQELAAACAGLPAPAMLEPGVAGPWSVRDVIAHVTTWEEEALRHLPVVLAGKRPPRYATVYGGIDAFNARDMGHKRRLSLAEVLRQRDATHRRLLAYLAAVPEGAFAGENRFRRRLRLDTYGHYRRHAAAIRRWRERRALSPRPAGRA